MPVGVPGSNRDDSRLRLRSGDPASAGAVLAPVMRDLEHVDARDRGRGEPVAQLFLLRVTGEKSTKLPVLNEDANGRVVDRGVRWGCQDVELGGAEGDGAIGGRQILRPARAHGVP